ncbi:MAG: sensor histidine kinase [Candidatus Brocadiaceae bacterium]|nr:sensor histidine kinase [Candidatus Brocadiaceae bacterium]
MFKTLYRKIAVILLCLFFFTGLLFVLVTFFTTELYVQEGVQKLNRNLAEYLVTHKFFIQDGKVNDKALKESFDMLMGINPSIELYLLDPTGSIMAYSAPDEKIKRKRVSLEPLKCFLSDVSRLPILGDDPRGADRQKVFSVSSIPRNGPLEGYLYIILGGEDYDSITNLLRRNYVFKLSIWIIIAGLLLVLMTGLYLFKVLTKRIQKLTSAMEGFKESNFLESVELHAVKDPGDEIDRLGAIFSKMSDRIIYQISAIRDADKMRRKLVSNISHDLRSPLTSLQGYLEALLIKDNVLRPEEKKNHLEIAIKHSNRLRKLITDLFELSKLQSQETVVKYESFHIGELVQDIIQKNQLVAQKKNIVIKLESSKNVHFVFADIGLIERAIQNLLDNALQNTKENSAIILTLKHQATEILVQVSDEGHGIEEQDIPYIFDRLYRTQKQKREDSDGTGLGLAITKRIIELHESSIEVLSEINVGTTFTFHLPVYNIIK